MAKCAICGKSIEGGFISGVRIELLRGNEPWKDYTLHLCPDHCEAVFEAAKDGARAEIEKLSRGEVSQSDID